MANNRFFGHNSMGADKMPPKNMPSSGKAMPKAESTANWKMPMGGSKNMNTVGFKKVKQSAKTTL
jgi:hypothetical protein